MDIKQLAKNKYVWVAAGGGIFIVWFIRHKAASTDKTAPTDTATQDQASSYSQQGYIPVGDPNTFGSAGMPGELGSTYGQETPSEVIGNLGTLLSTLAGAGLLPMMTGGGAPTTPVAGATTAPPPSSPASPPPPAPTPTPTTITCPATFPHKACDSAQGSCCYRIDNLRCEAGKWVHDHVYMDGHKVTVPRGDTCGK